MSAITIILILVAMLFFLGMGAVYLLLVFIGKMTAPKDEGEGK